VAAPSASFVDPPPGKHAEGKRTRRVWIYLIRGASIIKDQPPPISSCHDAMGMPTSLDSAGITGLQEMPWRHHLAPDRRLPTTV